MLKYILVYFCTAIECLPLESIDNGTITYSLNISVAYRPVGSTAVYSCDEGFFLVVTDFASEVRTCEDNDGAGIIGVWSGQAPHCAGNYYFIKICMFKINVKCKI